ncbi:MAG: DNA-3-methyladenine glycosylase 2 family protein [Planctomycetaceae bacterium]
MPAEPNKKLPAHAELQRHFRKRDPLLAKVIAQVGPMTIKVQRNHFQTLVASIISQQISTAAARTIRQRLVDHLHPGSIEPQTLLEVSPEQMREFGISKQKANYLRDLTERCHAQQLKLNQLHRKSDEDIISELTQVKGIGRWSAQMFLIFALRRPNVFASGDLGVQNGIREIYGLAERPDAEQLAEIHERWQPFATAGSWYCWRYLEFLKNG